MAKKLLNQKEQWYADTVEEAKEIVAKAEESDALIAHKISTKHNKYGEYQLVDINYQHATPKEFMENGDGKKSDAPDGQMNMEEVEPLDLPQNDEDVEDSDDE